MSSGRRVLPSPEARSNRAGSSARNILMLFLASFLALYFELVVIRYLSTEIRIFAYLKNLALVASFFGIGLGMILGDSPKTLKRLFPLFAALLFLLVAFAPVLHLTHLPVPGQQYEIFGHTPTLSPGWAAIWFFLGPWVFFAIVPAILYVVVIFFLPIGGLVGQRLALLEPLPGYGWNLAGSLAGILAFTALSFSSAPPAVWIFLGMAVAIPFFFRERWALAVLALLVCVLALPSVRNLRDHNYDSGGHSLPQQTLWSPYYRITFLEVPPPPGWPRPPAYLVDVNHDYHQKILDLSPEFMARNFPSAELNREGLAAYTLPYRFAPHPARVLVVGAGTGNDVAAALRHGATHVDAVEIDPSLVRLGRKYHPEHPYDSPRVSVFVNDARAFFKRTQQKYDLIVFGFLDSHTMFSSLSVLRLDDYVYTMESFGEAKSLLAPNGTAVLAFDSGRTSFITDRIFFTLTRAFGNAPTAYYTGYDGAGVVFVEGNGSESKVGDYPEISDELKSHQATAIVSTDHWPFLYLQSRTIPIPVIGVVILFLTFSLGLLRRRVPFQNIASPQNLHLFWLGAGFMLLETKAVTELSLLFGSTWIVNAVVITAFLVMGLLANTLMIFRQVSIRLSYILLFALLGLDLFLTYSGFAALPGGIRVVTAAVFAALPIFFSGLIFSRAFRDVAQPGEALGVNLMGAVIGGTLENSVMLGGTPVLGVLAILLYFLSALSLRRRRSVATV
jgi:SAM-dependent methyltransferase